MLIFLLQDSRDPYGRYTMVMMISLAEVIRRPSKLIANVDAGNCISCCPYLLLATGPTEFGPGIMSRSHPKLADALIGCRHRFKSSAQPPWSLCLRGELTARTTQHRGTEGTEDAQRKSPGHLSDGFPGYFIRRTSVAVLLALATAIACQAQNPSSATQQRPRQVNPNKEQKEPDDVL